MASTRFALHPPLPDPPRLHARLVGAHADLEGGRITRVARYGFLHGLDDPFILRKTVLRAHLERCHLFALAESLGGVESLIEHPALMTHGSIPERQRAALGIGDSLVRLSVGVEDVDDLRRDLRDALDGI